MADLNAALSNNKQTLKAADKKQQTHHYAVGLFVSSFLHQAGQLTEVLLVLLQESWGSITEGNAHSLLDTIQSHDASFICTMCLLSCNRKKNAQGQNTKHWPTNYIYISMFMLQSCAVIIILTV